jgi:hypothetical protein
MSWMPLQWQIVHVVTAPVPALNMVRHQYDRREPIRLSIGITVAAGPRIG